VAVASCIHRKAVANSHNHCLPERRRETMFHSMVLRPAAKRENPVLTRGMTRRQHGTFG
jgi:hypothetical protein